MQWKARRAVEGGPHAAYIWKRALQREREEGEAEEDGCKGPGLGGRSPFLRSAAWSLRPRSEEERPHDLRSARKEETLPRMNPSETITPSLLRSLLRQLDEGDSRLSAHVSQRRHSIYLTRLQLSHRSRDEKEPAKAAVEILSDKMDHVYVISFPLILLMAILALACYLFGRSRGRRETTRPTFVPGPPAPPPQVFYPPQPPVHPKP